MQGTDELDWVGEEGTRNSEQYLQGENMSIPSKLKKNKGHIKHMCPLL
jgi:hypothetical protein